MLVAECGESPALTRNEYGFSIALALKIGIRFKDNISQFLLFETMI
jgi:hypothetical protein